MRGQVIVLDVAADHDLRADGQPGVYLAGPFGVPVDAAHSGLSGMVRGVAPRAFLRLRTAVLPRTDTFRGGTAPAGVLCTGPTRTPSSVSLWVMWAKSSHSLTSA